MKAKTLSFIALATIAAACADDPAALQKNVRPEMSVSSDGRYILDLNGNAKGVAAQVSALGGTVESVNDVVGFAVVTGLSDAAAQSLKSVSGVAEVYNDEVVSLNTHAAIGEAETMQVDAASANTPNTAFRYSHQWNMRVINAPAAWAAGHRGNAGVTIAILDTGIDYNSYDMNGQVDLTRSKSFVPSDDAYIAAHFPTRNAVDDLNGHGTNVATQASSNATLFAGVTSKTKLIAVKVLGRSGGGTLSGILNGLVWAADHGANVANMSLGVSGGVSRAKDGTFIGVTNKVFNYANRKGMLVVVAAGNDGANMDNDGLTMAAYCEASHVVCVSATGPTSSTNAFSGPWSNQDAPAYYTNYGKSEVSVAAPGGTGAGWVPSVCARHLVVSGPTDSYPCNVPSGFFVEIGYAGTSQASPHVAGLAAMIASELGITNPAQLKHALLNAVDDLGAPGADPFYGAGRINVAKAF